MKNYKLKEKAVPFFDHWLSRKVETLDFWGKNHVLIQALEEVEDVYITYGIKVNEISTDLSSHDGTLKLGKLHFTLNISDLSGKNYNSLTSESENLRKLMAAIQNTVTDFVSGI